jgi:hypothetical protein
MLLGAGSHQGSFLLLLLSDVVLQKSDDVFCFFVSREAAVPSLTSSSTGSKWRAHVRSTEDDKPWSSVGESKTTVAAMASASSGKDVEFDSAAGLVGEVVTEMDRISRINKYAELMPSGGAVLNGDPRLSWKISDPERGPWALAAGQGQAYRIGVPSCKPSPQVLRNGEGKVIGTEVLSEVLRAVTDDTNNVAWVLSVTHEYNDILVLYMLYARQGWTQERVLHLNALLRQQVWHLSWYQRVYLTDMGSLKGCSSRVCPGIFHCIQVTTAGFSMDDAKKKTEKWHAVYASIWEEGGGRQRPMPLSFISYQTRPNRTELSWMESEKRSLPRAPIVAVSSSSDGPHLISDFDRTFPVDNLSSLAFWYPHALGGPATTAASAPTSAPPLGSGGSSSTALNLLQSLADLSKSSGYSSFAPARPSLFK